MRRELGPGEKALVVLAVGVIALSAWELAGYWAAMLVAGLAILFAILFAVVIRP